MTQFLQVIEDVVAPIRAVIRPGGITPAHSDCRLLLFLLCALLLYRPAQKRSNAVLDLKMIASSLKNIFLYN